MPSPPQPLPQTLTSQQEEGKDDDGGVAEVEHGAGSALDLQLGGVEVYAVDEEVDGCEAAGQERPPPPVVVLREENLVC